MEFPCPAKSTRHGEFGLWRVWAAPTDGLPVEHRVKRRNLVHGNGLDLADLRRLVHGGQGQPAAMLFLRQGDSGEAHARASVSQKVAPRANTTGRRTTTGCSTSAAFSALARARGYLPAQSRG